MKGEITLRFVFCFVGKLKWKLWEAFPGVIAVADEESTQTAWSIEPRKGLYKGLEGVVLELLSRKWRNEQPSRTQVFRACRFRMSTLYNIISLYICFVLCTLSVYTFTIQWSIVALSWVEHTFVLAFSRTHVVYTRYRDWVSKLANICLKVSIGRVYLLGKQW